MKISCWLMEMGRRGRRLLCGFAEEEFKGRRENYV
jgi:hypothetical protein